MLERNYLQEDPNLSSVVHGSLCNLRESRKVQKSRKENAIFRAKEDRACEQEIQQSCKSQNKTCRLFTD